MKLYSPTRIYRKGERAYFAGSFDDAHLRWPNIADFRAEGGHRLHIDPKTNDEGVLKLFVEAEATGLLLLQQGHYLLHASSVLVNSRAIVFCGTPGAGKSSTAAAFVKAGCAPLADDMSVIKWIDQRPYIVPQGPNIKIWDNTAENLDFSPEKLNPCFEGHNKFYYEFEGDYPTKPVPLAKVLFLHRSNRYGQKQAIPANKVPFELLKHFPLPHQLLKGAYLQKHFIESLQIAQNAEIYRQKRPEGFDNLQKWVDNFLRIS